MENQSNHDYLDNTFKTIEDNFGFVFKEPTDVSDEEIDSANGLIGDFMQSMLLNSISDTTCS